MRYTSNHELFTSTRRKDLYCGRGNCVHHSGCSGSPFCARLTAANKSMHTKVVREKKKRFRFKVISARRRLNHIHEAPNSVSKRVESASGRSVVLAPALAGIGCAPNLAGRRRQLPVLRVGKS